MSSNPPTPPTRVTNADEAALSYLTKLMAAYYYEIDHTSILVSRAWNKYKGINGQGAEVFRACIIQRTSPFNDSETTFLCAPQEGSSRVEAIQKVINWLEGHEGAHKKIMQLEVK